jgi:hypothetical protein
MPSLCCRVIPARDAGVDRSARGPRTSVRGPRCVTSRMRTMWTWVDTCGSIVRAGPTFNINTDTEKRNEMTEMAMSDFAMPSTFGGGAGHPSFAQLEGRVVWFLPLSRDDNATSELKKEPHTRLCCDVAFLTGAPIDAALRQSGEIKLKFDPPIKPGQVWRHDWINQSWFTMRLKDKVGVPGFPGMIGVMTMGRSKAGNQMWMLADPSAEQLADATAWFRARQQSPGDFAYIPAPPPVPVATPFTQAPAATGPWAPQAASPFAQAPAATGPWAPQAPPAGMTVVSGPPVSGVVASQPGPEVPPWQR